MRFLEHDEADDPILSLVNLIDLFLVVIGILLSDHLTSATEPLVVSPITQRTVSPAETPVTSETTSTSAGYRWGTQVAQAGCPASARSPSPPNESS